MFDETAQEKFNVKHVSSLKEDKPNDWIFNTKENLPVLQNWNFFSNGSFFTALITLMISLFLSLSLSLFLMDNKVVRIIEWST